MVTKECLKRIIWILLSAVFLVGCYDDGNYITEEETIESESLFYYDAKKKSLTRLTAEGAYTHNDKPVLLCAVRRREIVAVKRLVNEIDPTAFFIVCDAREVLGEGFGEYKPDGL